MFRPDFLIIFVARLFKRALYCFVVLFVCSNLHASGLDSKGAANQQAAYANINFHILPSNYHYRATRSIIRDYKGLMWFGTENGLVQFDGINQKVYEHDTKDPKSIRYNTVNALFEDKNKRLWVGTSHGLNFYNRQKDNFESVDTSSNEAAIINQSYISSISAGSDSIIWIGTFSYGLFRLNVNTHKIKRYTLAQETEFVANITCIQSHGNNKLWVGTQTGLILFDTESGQCVSFFNEKDNLQSISSNNITSIQKDKFENVWVGTLDGGLNLIVNTGNTTHFKRINSHLGNIKMPRNAINKLLADESGYLWIGTENEGLLRLNIQRGTLEVYTNEIGNQKSISSNSIWSIYQDIEGRVWIGSYNKGISVYDAYYSKFDGFQINPYSRNGLIHNDVRGFCEDQDGKVWIATDGGGICRFDLQTQSFDKNIGSGNMLNAITNNSIQTIICDFENNIWLGSWGGGIDRLKSDGTFVKNYKVENNFGVGNNKIRILYQDKRGNIWAGTNGSGLFLYNHDSDKFEPFVYRDVLSQDRAYIVTIVSDSNNRLWVGTLAGLVYFELGKFNQVIRCDRYTSDNSGLSINSINSLLIDSQEQIWIGTTNGGLNVLSFDNRTFKVLRKKDGLPSNNILGILEDNVGHIWISTSNGISKINKKTFELSIFSIEDGLNSNEFYSKSCYKTKNGMLLFGSGKGFNLIQPEKIKINHHLPNVLLTELKIDNQPVAIASKSSPLKKLLSETDTLILNYKQTSFSIDFVALNYTRPSQNEFAYKLEGFDVDWIYIGSKTTANYTKVNPGKYVFKVKGANNDGVWGNHETTMHIIVKPPFWKTKWAYIFYLLTFFGIMTFVFWIWQKQINVNNLLMLEKLAKKKEREQNIKNLEFFTNISHEFRTPLSLIIGPLDPLLDSAPPNMIEPIRVIQRNAQRLLSLTNNLLDLRRLEDGGIQLNIKKTDFLKSTETIVDYFSENIKRLNINLSVGFPDVDAEFYLDEEKYTTILFNLLSNAIKYTNKNGSIHIEVKYQSADKQLEVSVVNTGDGIEPSDLPFVFDKFYQTSTGRRQKQFGTGIGLALSKGLVELHGGKIWVTSKPGQETNFTFTISVNKSSYHLADFGGEPIGVVPPVFYFDDESEQESGQILELNDEERPLVLIVEDNVDLRNFLAKELATFYNVMWALNGEEGLRTATDSIPDLIISDIVMPVMDGFELCKAIKTDVRTSHIPFIMLTAKSTANEQIEGFDNGADAYITKPFQLKLLQTQIANLIQSRKEIYARFSQDVYIIARKQSGNEEDQNFLQSTIDFIIENITDSKLNIEVLSKHHNMSHRNLYRKIKALTGNTVVEFIKIVRLKQALKLMETQQHNLTEISYLTGFTSPSYFTKNFREFYGKPPSDYLKM